MIINVHAPNRASKYMKEILIELKGEINSRTLMMGDFSSSLSVTDRAARQKINKETGFEHCHRPNEPNRYIYRTLKTKNKQQNENRKIHKYVEIKLLTLKQPNKQERNHKRT